MFLLDYILLTVSIRRVKFRTRYCNQLHPPDSQGGFSIRSLTRQALRELWLSVRYSTQSIEISLELIPPSPWLRSPRDSKTPVSYCDYGLLEEDQLGNGCIKGQPWCSVVSTGEPCINPVSLTRLRPAPLYGDLHSTVVLLVYTPTDPGTRNPWYTAVEETLCFDYNSILTSRTSYFIVLYIEYIINH